MRTRVTRIGRTVPTGFTGTVRAVWRKALAVDARGEVPTSHDPALITLVRADVPMTAASMALQVGEGFDFGDGGPRPGDTVRFDGSTLIVGAAGSIGSIVAVEDGAAHYDGRLPDAGIRANPAALTSAARAARARRDTMCSHNTLGRAAAAGCDQLLDELGRSAAHDDAAAAARAAQALLGFGPGLTPSGDDVLCGFILGRHLRGGACRAADDAVRRVASEAAGLTTDVSAVQLRLAADGRFGEALLDVALALGADRLTGLEDSIARCVAEGATSGADALLGLVAGARSAGSAMAASA